MIEVKNLTKIYRLSKKQMAQMKVKNNKQQKIFPLQQRKEKSMGC